MVSKVANKMRLLLYTSVIHNLLFGAEILNRWFEDLYIRWDIECNQCL